MVSLASPEWGPIEYFRGVGKMLLRAGIRPAHTGTAVRRFDSRCAQRRLRENCFSTDASAFALVGHSMGGLDARYLITHLDPDRRVKSLLTVATPHRGSPMARWFLKARGPIPAWIQAYRQAGLGELTPEARAAMPIPDREDVELRFLRKLSRDL